MLCQSNTQKQAKTFRPRLGIGGGRDEHQHWNLVLVLVRDVIRKFSATFPCDRVIEAGLEISNMIPCSESCRPSVALRPSDRKSPHPCGLGRRPKGYLADITGSDSMLATPGSYDLAGYGMCLFFMCVARYCGLWTTGSITHVGFVLLFPCWESAFRRKWLKMGRVAPKGTPEVYTPALVCFVGARHEPRPSNG